jgi:indolepyruvate ferredoxin oxidoreductase
MFMLGFAWQRGWVPVSRAALMRAIELNGVAVPDNQLAFEWGRRAAWDPEGTECVAAKAESLPAARRLSQGLDEAIARRREILVAYQNEAYAQRYVDLVDRVRRAEAQAVPGNTRFAEIVARNAFKLMACKDEYEVARLFGDAEFRRALHANFEGDFQVRLHLAGPMFSHPDPVTGEARKRSYGPWMLHALRVVAKLKMLRGTPFDIFGRTPERRMERELCADYQRTVSALVSDLRADNHELACQIADVPDSIRGFGPVKQRNADAARQRQVELMGAWSRRSDPTASQPRRQPQVTENV